MKLNKKSGINIDTTNNNIQNNQRKENLRNLNKKIKINKNFSNLHRQFKRSMFGISSTRNLKKSGNILSSKGNDSTIKIVEKTTGESRIKSLDLAMGGKYKDFIKVDNIEQIPNPTTAIAVKNVRTGELSTMRVNRYLASYSKKSKDHIVVWKGDILKTASFRQFKKTRIEEAEQALKEQRMSKEQFLVFIKRINALDLSYAHSVVYDIIEEDEEFYTVIYHVITTSFKGGDMGGPNRFKSIFLYHDLTKNKSFYTWNLTYLHKIRKIDFQSVFVLKNKEAFKNDSFELQGQLVKCVQRVNEVNKFKLLDVNKNCIDLLPSDIDPSEEFPDSEYGDLITGHLDYLEDIS